ncbi:MAG: ATP-dependent protease subunit HslV [bacterium]|nr:ATP-dependent protease subunit HslV [bacterium]
MDTNTFWHSTTIIAVKKDNQIALAADGQVSFGETVMKHHARKIRKLADGKVLVGFAGAAADAFALLDRFEEKIAQYHQNVRRAAVELAKEWRTDRILRRLEAMLVVASRNELSRLNRDVPTDSEAKSDVFDELPVQSGGKSGEIELLVISGNGEIIEPDDGIVAIGSGGAYALAAARALCKHSTLSAKEIARESMRIAGSICVYTNTEITVEEL